MADEPVAEEEASEASSAASSTSSRSPYTASDGPGFDPKAPVGEVPGDGEEELAEGFEEAWQEEQVRDWLLNAGGLAHASFGVGELDWQFTEADLKRIAPPATRIMNRYQPSRAIAAYSDPAAVAMGFGLYGWRSALERVAVKREQGAQDEHDGGADTPAPVPPAGASPTFAEQLLVNRTQLPEEETG